MQSRMSINFLDKLDKKSEEKFAGLSQYKVIKIALLPYDSPEIVSFNTSVAPPIDAPFIKLFILLINQIHSKNNKIKSTLTGKLPRDLCRDIEKLYLSEEEFKFLLRDKLPIMKEEHFLELHKVRLISQFSGYIKRNKNKFTLTKSSINIIKKGFSIFDYLNLLKASTLRYNWSYYDIYDEIDFLQGSFLFTLYLLKIFGDEFSPKEFYAEKFIQAFPSVVENVSNKDYLNPETEIKKAYIIRALDFFAIGFGFAKCDGKFSNLPRLYENIKKTDFLDKFIEFK